MLPMPARAGPNSISSTHSAIHTALCHQLTQTFIISHFICTKYQITDEMLWGRSSISRPMTPSPVSYAAPLWITLGLFCCSYWLLSPLTYHGISAHRTIKHTVFCSFNHGNFDYFRPQLFIIRIDHGHSKLIMCF